MEVLMWGKFVTQVKSQISGAISHDVGENSVLWPVGTVCVT